MLQLTRLSPGAAQQQSQISHVTLSMLRGKQGSRSLRNLEDILKVRRFFLCTTPDKGGPELSGGGRAAESREAQPVGGRCSSEAFQKQQQQHLKKEVEAEVTTVGSSGGGRDENAKEK